MCDFGAIYTTPTFPSVCSRNARPLEWNPFVKAFSAMSQSFFTSGGTLRGDAPSYIVRQADQALSERLRGGDFCYVLTSRQMGKSSIMSRMAYLLRS